MTYPPASFCSRKRLLRTWSLTNAAIQAITHFITFNTVSDPAFFFLSFFFPRRFPLWVFCIQKRKQFQNSPSEEKSNSSSPPKVSSGIILFIALYPKSTDLQTHFFCWKHWFVKLLSLLFFAPHWHLFSSNQLHQAYRKVFEMMNISLPSASPKTFSPTYSTMEQCISHLVASAVFVRRSTPPFTM